MTPCVCTLVGRSRCPQSPMLAEILKITVDAQRRWLLVCLAGAEALLRRTGAPDDQLCIWRSGKDGRIMEKAAAAALFHRCLGASGVGRRRREAKKTRQAERGGQACGEVLSPTLFLACKSTTKRHRIKNMIVFRSRERNAIFHKHIGRVSNF